MTGAVLQKIIFCGCNQLYWEQHILGGKTVNTQTNSSKRKNKTKNTLNSPGSTGSPHPGNEELKLEDCYENEKLQLMAYKKLYNYETENIEIVYKM